MARYMLDTDTCSYIMKRSSEPVLRRVRAVPVTDVCISVITKSELLYGVEVSPRRTQDISEFNRVKGLTLENWTARPVRRSRVTDDK